MFLPVDGGQYDIKEMVLRFLLTAGCFVIMAGCLNGCGSRDVVMREIALDGTVEVSSVFAEEETGRDGASSQENGGQEGTEAGTLYVHVCGEVRNPGVYQVPEGSRVYELVDLAGGFTENADGSYVNQAAAVTDGEKIRIPSVQEALQSAEKEIQPPQGNTGESGESLVNLNTGTEQELCTLPGIGKGKAAAIMEYRERNGGFQKPEDILKVDGIKEGTYHKLKDRITVK